MTRAINIEKDRVTVTFPISDMLDEELLYNADEPKVIATTVRYGLKLIAWRKMWRHAGHKLEALTDKFVGVDTYVDGNGNFTATFFIGFPAVPEKVPDERSV